MLAHRTAAPSISVRTSRTACVAPRLARRRAVQARAEQQDGGEAGTRSSRIGAAATEKPGWMSTVDRMLARYDFLSTGCGALAVTGYCVARGQDPATAAAITVTATVVALVANELLFEPPTH